MLVPVELGGDGASVSDAVDVCYMLGVVCGSSAMIFAMHQIQVVILLLHARDGPWHPQLLRRLCDEQLLFASSTTENQMGGAARHSACSVECEGTRFSLVKNGTVMSHGAEADGTLLAARARLYRNWLTAVVAEYKFDGLLATGSSLRASAP